MLRDFFGIIFDDLFAVLLFDLHASKYTDAADVDSRYILLQRSLIGYVTKELFLFYSYSAPTKGKMGSHSDRPNIIIISQPYL